MKLKVPKLVWDGGGERGDRLPRFLGRPLLSYARLRPPDDERRTDARGLRQPHRHAAHPRPGAGQERSRHHLRRHHPPDADLPSSPPTSCDELAEAGISDEQIRFVVASGTHGAHDNLALRKKVGQEILERFLVFKHNPYENCVSVGTTSHGTALAVNREVMSCDLKIGIGTVFPHPQAGFGGGGKLILPGVSHIDSIDHFHRTIFGSPPGTVGIGNWDENPMRSETEEAAKLVGLDVVVNALMNGRCEVTQLLVGSPRAGASRSVRRAKEVYATEPPAKARISWSPTPMPSRAKRSSP